MNRNNIVELNVGGKIMLTSRTTLANIEFFEAYFKRWEHSSATTTTTDDEPKFLFDDRNIVPANYYPPLQIFLDVDPHLFIHILNKLRHPKYVLPDDENIGILCDYLGIEIDKPEISVAEPSSPPRNTIKTISVRDNYLTQYSTNLHIKRGEHLNSLILIDNINVVTHIAVLCKDIYVYRISQMDMELFFDGPFENIKKIKTYKLKDHYIDILNDMSHQLINDRNCYGITMMIQTASFGSCNRNDEPIIKFVFENTVEL